MTELNAQWLRDGWDRREECWL